MKRRTLTAATAAATSLLLAGSAGAAGGGVGSTGIGDPYYPAYGNGGYDVKHYGIKVAYDPKADSISGRSTVRARTTERLKQFNLDLVLPASGSRRGSPPKTAPPPSASRRSPPGGSPATTIRATRPVST